MSMDEFTKVISTGSMGPRGIVGPQGPIGPQGDVGPVGPSGGIGTSKLLYQTPSGFNWSTYHQSKIKILGDSTGHPACGKFTALNSTVILHIDIQAYNFGGAWAPATLNVGVTSATADQLLTTALTYPAAAAPGVSELHIIQALQFGIDVTEMCSRRVVLTDLVVGREYTWQLVSAIEATSTMDVLDQTSNFGHLALSPDNSWLAVAEWVGDQVQIIHLGGRPGWHYSVGAIDNWPIASSGIPELGHFYSNISAPISVGDQPVDLKFSPDNNTLAVANYNAGTVTFIDVATQAVIGTSEVILAANVAAGLSWLADSSGVLVWMNTAANLYLVTNAAIPVVTYVGTYAGNTVSWIKRKEKTTTNHFWMITKTQVVATVYSGGAVVTQTIVTFPGAIGTGRPATDANGNIWVPVSGGTYDQQVVQVKWGTNVDGTAAAIGLHYTPRPGHAVVGVSTTGDGQELWIWSNDNGLMAIQTSDGAISQENLGIGGFESPPILGEHATGITDIIQSDDGYIYVGMYGTSLANWIHEWPGSVFTISNMGLVGGNITVIAEGVV